MNPYITQFGFARNVRSLRRSMLGTFFVTALMLAQPQPLASTDLHSAPTTTPRFGQAIILSAKQPKKIMVPKPAATKLLSVVNQKDILARHRILADRVLRALPRYCRENLESFYVTYDKNAANRGLGGESTIIVMGTVPDREFMALIVHECGHVTDLGGLQGDQNSGYSGFFDGNTPIYQNDASVSFYLISWLTPNTYQPNTKSSDFVSGYAASDPFEDFAESFAYYALQKDAFKKIAANNPVIKAKYDFMEQVVFSGIPPIAEGKHVPQNSVPWDVTRLPYIWHAKR